MEKPIKNCYNCKHYIQHYAIIDFRLEKINCSHCACYEYNKKAAIKYALPKEYTCEF